MKTTAVKIFKITSELFGASENTVSKFFIDRIEGTNNQVNERVADSLPEAVSIAYNIAKEYGVKVEF